MVYKFYRTRFVYKVIKKIRVGLGLGAGPEQGGVRLGSVTLAMGGEAGIPQGLGQPAALLWLLLLNVATLELRGSPATAAPGPTAGDGGALRGCAPTWQAQRLAPGATGVLGPPFGPRSPNLQGLRAAGCDQGLVSH